MQPSELIHNILSDIRVELLDEFDQNFTRKAFFTRKWKRSSNITGKGSLMVKSGALRRSLRAKVSGTSIIFSADSPYARIHNEGGEITVTRRMKRCFWKMYYLLSLFKKDNNA
jgi:phage gpG-like protein